MGLIDPQFDKIASTLRTVLFDLDGTLRTNRPSYVQAFYDCAVRLGAEDSRENRRLAARWTHYYWAESPEIKQDHLEHGSENESFWLNYARRSLLAFGCTPEYATQLAPQVSDYMQHEHHPENWVPPDVPETLQALKENGYLLGLVSNRQRSCQGFLAEIGLLEYFNLVLVAGEVGTGKPDPLIFTQALQRLDCQAAQALYVGDNYYADVVGAQNAGILPVLIDPEEIFPEADCPVIDQIRDLQHWLL